MLIALLFAMAQASVTPVSANQHQVGPHRFTLPPGHVVRRVTSPDLVERPISAVYDRKGRLFVTESSGSNEPSAVQAKKAPHRVLRLTDTNGDGVFDTRTVFADNLMLPQGIAMVGDEVWVGAPPQIIRLIDANDDGIAERREIWHDGGTLTGCMNDLHGPILGPDGMIYWTKGAFAKQTHATPGGNLVTRASHIFRAKRDGSGLESVMTGGMDNPVGLAFSDTGDLFVTCTFVHHPAGGLRDGVLHVIPGGLYGKDHPPIHEPGHLWTSPDLMPVLADLGPAAPCGLAVARSNALGLRNKALSCQFNLRRVQAHTMQRSGSALSATTTDVIVSDFQDFHPTDVVEDADGSLLVVDTGGWYKLCCPSSQMVKAEALGAIYRIEKTGTTPVADPRGMRIDWNSSDKVLAGLLADPRHAVRERVADTLVSRKAITELAEVAQSASIPREARLAAVWALGRLDGNSADVALEMATADRVSDIRLSALRMLAARGGKAGTESAARLAVTDSDPSVRRAAIERLADTRDSRWVPALISALAQTSAPADRAWEHAVVRALVQCGGNPANLKEAWNNNMSRRLLLVVMDQSGQMTSIDATMELLDKADAKSMAVARWVLSRHAEWDADLATRVAGMKDIPIWLEPAVLGRLSSRPEGRSLLAQWLSGTDPKKRNLALEAIRQSTGPFPNEWVAPLASMLAKSSSTERSEALNLAALLARRKALPAAWAESLKTIANNAKELIADRLLAMVALPPDNSIVAELAPLLHRDRPQQERQLALEALTRLQPAGNQWDLLAGTLASASPTDIGKILDLFQVKAGVAAGMALAHALEKSEIASSLSIPAVRTIINAHAPAVRSAADPILARLDPGADGEKKRVAKLITELPAGDARRGHAVFNSAKTACAACHKIGYVGGDAGPDLSRIGQIRSRQDLIEAIVAPSVSFVRSYEPVVVTLASGKPVAGVLKSETDAEVVIQTGPTAIERLERRNVESVTPGLVSLMPSGLEKQITAQELADLVAFLLERR